MEEYELFTGFEDAKLGYDFWKPTRSTENIGTETYNDFLSTTTAVQRNHLKFKLLVYITIKSKVISNRKHQITTCDETT